MEPAAAYPGAESPPELTPRDREWLTLYLDSSEDLPTLAARLAVPGSPPHLSTSPPPHLLDLAAWLRTPAVRAALADWDYAQRRARAARDEADRRIAIDALKAVCHRLAPSGDSLRASSAPTQQVGAEPSCHGIAPSDDSLPIPSTQHAGAEPPPASAPSASSADPPGEFARLVEVRRAATTILRTLSGAMATARRGYGHRHARGSPSHRITASPSHPHRPRRISDFTFSDPAVAERLLEKERRENDRLEKLIQRTLAISGDGEPLGTPSLRDGPPGTSSLRDQHHADPSSSSDDLPSRHKAPAPPIPTVSEIMRDYRSNMRARADEQRRHHERRADLDRRAAHLAAAAGHVPFSNTS